MKRNETTTRLHRRVAVAGIASALLTIAASGPASADSAASTGVALECGSVVTRDVRLSRDVTGCTGNGLVVGANGVDIDLNGHQISGNGPFASLSGIDIDAYANVRIHDGRISDFSRGVLAYDADTLRITRVTVTDTLEGVNIEGSAHARVVGNRLVSNREGLVLRTTEMATVAGNSIVANDTTGITDIDSRHNPHARNLVAANTFDGIQLESARSTVVIDNTVKDNGLNGISAVNGTGVHYVGNRVVGNDDDGIEDSGDRTVWRRNVASHNGAVGLHADGPDHVDAGGNRSHGNGGLDCVGIRCNRS